MKPGEKRVMQRNSKAALAAFAVVLNYVISEKGSEALDDGDFALVTFACADEI